MNRATGELELNSTALQALRMVWPGTGKEL
jgi:hypothetical protein